MTSLIINNKISAFTQEEKNEILRNAYTSFVHGVDHFSEYKDGEKNIKFAVLHIFNTIELLTKAYLGSINLNLLKEKIDDEKVYNDKLKMAGIKILLDRMGKFSEVDFGKKLREKIEILRNKRNQIEHSKFIFEWENDLLVLMCEVINGIIIFSRNHIYFDICPVLLSNTKVKFDLIRIRLDKNYAKVIEDVEHLRSSNYSVAECPSCLNLTVPYRHESLVKCFMCKENFYVEKCHSCKNLCLDIQNGQGVCDECMSKDAESAIGAISFFTEKEQDRRESLPKENYE